MPSLLGTVCMEYGQHRPTDESSLQKPRDLREILSPPKPQHGMANAMTHSAPPPRESLADLKEKMQARLAEIEERTTSRYQDKKDATAKAIVDKKERELQLQRDRKEVRAKYEKWNLSVSQNEIESKAAAEKGKAKRLAEMNQANWVNKKKRVSLRIENMAVTLSGLVAAKPKADVKEADAKSAPDAKPKAAPADAAQSQPGSSSPVKAKPATNSSPDSKASGGVAAGDADRDEEARVIFLQIKDASGSKILSQTKKIKTQPDGKVNLSFRESVCFDMPAFDKGAMALNLVVLVEKVHPKPGDAHKLQEVARCEIALAMGFEGKIKPSSTFVCYAQNASSSVLLKNSLNKSATGDCISLGAKVVDIIPLQVKLEVVRAKSVKEIPFSVDNVYVVVRRSQDAGNGEVKEEEVCRTEERQGVKMPGWKGKIFTFDFEGTAADQVLSGDRKGSLSFVLFDVHTLSNPDGFAKGSLDIRGLNYMAPPAAKLPRTNFGPGTVTLTRPKPGTENSGKYVGQCCGELSVKVLVVRNYDFASEL